MNKTALIAGGSVAVGTFILGFVLGHGTRRVDTVPVAIPQVHTIHDTVDRAPQWVLDHIKNQDELLARKPRRDTLYLTSETVVLDSFPYPVYVTDTSARFWWPERGTFGQKPGDVTTVVTREPFSGRASVLQYNAPGPVLSFVADTSPKPRITFGTFVAPKHHHGFLVDLGLVVGSLGVGLGTGAVLGCFGGN